MLPVHVPAGPYKLLLSSDEEVFGGWKNLSKETDGEHHTNGVSQTTTAAGSKITVMSQQQTFL